MFYQGCSGSADEVTRSHGARFANAMLRRFAEFYSVEYLKVFDMDLMRLCLSSCQTLSMALCIACVYTTIYICVYILIYIHICVCLCLCVYICLEINEHTNKQTSNTCLYECLHRCKVLNTFKGLMRPNAFTDTA